jgi:hypothetical protein
MDFSDTWIKYNRSASDVTSERALQKASQPHNGIWTLIGFMTWLENKQIIGFPLTAYSFLPYCRIGGMASICFPVTEPPGPDSKVAIIKQLWGKDIAKERTDAYRSYFRYYSIECRRPQMGISKESWLSSSMAAKTHADILSSCGPSPLRNNLVALMYEPYFGIDL